MSKKILLAACVLAIGASTAQATTVSVRVSAVGPSSLPRTTVTMPASAPVKDGHPCSPTTAGAALDAAVGDPNWAAHWDSGFGELVLDSIYGEAHPFGSHLFWAVYIDGRSALDGLCNVDVVQDDYVQYVALCDPYDPPTDGSPCYGEPLQIAAPATAAPGAATTFTVTESQTDINTGVTTVVPSQGATVSGGGRQATTDSSGHATLALADRGPVTVTATKGTRVDDSAPVCVTDGADGFCGTAKPGEPAPPQAPAATCVHDRDDGYCGTPDHKAAYTFITSIREHQRFRRRHAPRRLAGRVDPDASGTKDVRMRLTRTRHGRCSTFDGRALKWRHRHTCGAVHGLWFSASTKADWSYLLPKRLARGRYVLDARAVDGAGNSDVKRDRGRNVVVFHVR